MSIETMFMKEATYFLGWVDPQGKLVNFAFGSCKQVTHVDFVAWGSEG